MKQVGPRRALRGVPLDQIPGQPRPVLIHWIDSCGWHGWVSQDSIDKGVAEGGDDCWSCGLLESINDKVVAIVQGTAKSGNKHELMVIPRVSVLGVWFLDTGERWRGGKVPAP